MRENQKTVLDVQVLILESARLLTPTTLPPGLTLKDEWNTQQLCKHSSKVRMGLLQLFRTPETPG